MYRILYCIIYFILFFYWFENLTIHFIARDWGSDSYNTKKIIIVLFFPLNTYTLCYFNVP